MPSMVQANQDGNPHFARRGSSVEMQRSVRARQYIFLVDSISILSPLSLAFAISWLPEEMSALRSASHLSRLANDNVTIHSESGAAQAKGFPCDTHFGSQDPGGTNRYQPMSAIAAAWRRFNVRSASHR